MAILAPTKLAEAHDVGNTEENPPEYAEILRQNVHPTAATRGYGVAHTANTVTMPEATNAQLHFFAKREDIKGTPFLLDVR